MLWRHVYPRLVATKPPSLPPTHTTRPIINPDIEPQIPNERQHPYQKVQVGKDQEKAQSEKDSHSKNQGGKKPNQQPGTYTMKTFRKPNEQLFSQ